MILTAPDRLTERARIGQAVPAVIDGVRAP